MYQACEHDSLQTELVEGFCAEPNLMLKSLQLQLTVVADLLEVLVGVCVCPCLSVSGDVCVSNSLTLPVSLYPTQFDYMCDSQ